MAEEPVAAVKSCQRHIAHEPGVTAAIIAEPSVDIELAVGELHCATAGSSLLTCNDESTGVAQPALLHDAGDTSKPWLETQREDV